jgi:antitoxin (DNA-binding transcriptional repressor) of toxin-antitoxin stability system
VGTAEFRTNLAKYLKLARAGQNVVILQRGRIAFVLSRFEEAAPLPVLGCLRDRTEYVQGAVLNAKESWDGGDLP